MRTYVPQCGCAQRRPVALAPPPAALGPEIGSDWASSGLMSTHLGDGPMRSRRQTAAERASRTPATRVPWRGERQRATYIRVVPEAASMLANSGQVAAQCSYGVQGTSRDTLGT